MQYLYEFGVRNKDFYMGIKISTQINEDYNKILNRVNMCQWCLL